MALILIWLAAAVTVVGEGAVVVAEVKAPLIPAVLFPLSCLLLVPALLLWRSAMATRLRRYEEATGPAAAAVALSVIAALIVLFAGLLEDDCNGGLACAPDHLAASLLYLGGKIFLASGMVSCIGLVVIGAARRKYGATPKAEEEE